MHTPEHLHALVSLHHWPCIDEWVAALDELADMTDAEIEAMEEEPKP